MGALHATALSNQQDLSVAQLTRRLEREIAARRQAEELLENKSRELYQASEALRISAASLEHQRIQLNTILEHTHAAIFLARDDLTMLRANRAGLKMFCVNDEYYADVVISQLVAGPPEALAWIERRLEWPDFTDEPHREAVGRRTDGEEFPIEVTVTSIEHDGKSHSVWMMRDITRRKNDEARRARLERELAQSQKFEALGTLSSGVAHEINTPVQYVSDNVRFLKDTFGDLIDALQSCETALEGRDDEAVKAALAKIAAADLEFVSEDAPAALQQSLEGLDQVASIVKAIKSFAHPGGEEKIAADINQIVETTTTVARNQWKYIAHLKTDLASDLPPVPCLAGDLNQVILNLIVNAADAIEQARGEHGLGEIHVGTRCVGEYVEIAVADTGCGIPDDVKERIFDPFFTTKDIGKGSGQGLSIVYNIICQKHGGDILCDSTPGEGSTFTVRLPLTPQENREG